MSKEINLALQEGRYKDCIVLIRKSLKKDPDNHWLLANLSCCYYEQFKYKTALRYAKKAVEIDPVCPLALWYYATCVSMIGTKTKDFEMMKYAEQVYRHILNMGSHYLANKNPCGEGNKTRALVNDCRYNLALSADIQGDKKRASKWIKLHLRIRKRVRGSIYSAKEAKRLLNRVIS